MVSGFNSTIKAPPFDISKVGAAIKEFKQLNDKIESTARLSSLPFSVIGMPVVVSPWLNDYSSKTEHVQFRFPRSKKKRIRKKWAKRKENYRSVPVVQLAVVGGTLVLPGSIARKLLATPPTTEE